MKRRIALSIISFGFGFALGCVDTGAVADDQPLIEPDAAVDNGIGTSPISCPKLLCGEPGPTDTSGAAP